MSRWRTPDPEFRHPLEDLVVHAFQDNAVLDASSLAAFMGAGARTTAYHAVAHDVLEVMRQGGRLTRDAVSWYHLPEAPTVCPGYPCGIEYICDYCQAAYAAEASAYEGE